MIRTAFEKFRDWVRYTAWPAATGLYRDSEYARHVVTFAVGMFVGFALW